MINRTLTIAATDRIWTAFWICGFFIACLTLWSWQTSAAQSSPLGQHANDSTSIDSPQPIPATSSVGNYVWEDTNVDGIQGFLPAENPIPDVVVSLFHASGLLADMTITDSDGRYMFQSLNPGEYYLAFSFPNGMVPTKKNQGSDPDKDSDIDSITGLTSVFMLEAGTNDLSLDVGFTHAASISSWIWRDQNRNGLKDVDEPGAPATVVTLYDELDQIVQITPTNVDGYFTFPIITPGTYTLGVTPPPRMLFTTQGATRSGAFNSEVDPLTGRTDLFQVYVGPNDLNWGAGLIPALEPTALDIVADSTYQIGFSIQRFLPLVRYETPITTPDDIWDHQPNR